MAERDLKRMYRTRTEGDFPESIAILGRDYIKVENLRYGTNPHQPAAFYRPVDNQRLVLGAYEILKSGKSGLSQTNIEDMHHAVGILKYLERPACAVMKHCNPSGAAVRTGDMPLVQVYERARDADAQAAFGCVAVFNTEVDADTATAIMQTVVEGVAAPAFSPSALDILHDAGRFGKNKEIRLIRLPAFSALPKYIDDDDGTTEIKMFDDGSLVLAKSYLSCVRSTADLIPAYNDHASKGRIDIHRKPAEQELEDLLFAWYINIHVRSNGVVIVKNGQTLAVGTGQQDRVGAVEQAVAKAQAKYKGVETLDGAVLASDGFFPFRDGIDAATCVGIRAFCQPGGSMSDFDVIQACNEAGATMVFTGERCFSHH